MTALGQHRPFRQDFDSQSQCFGGDLSWLDLDGLNGFTDLIRDVLQMSSVVLGESGRIDSVCAVFEALLDDVKRISMGLAPQDHHEAHMAFTRYADQGSVGLRPCRHGIRFR